MAFIDKLLLASLSFATGVVVWAGLAGSAVAAGPKNWQLGFRPPVSPTAEEIHWFNDVVLLPVIIAIVVFVMGLLVYVIWRFSEKRNPTPSKTTHNTAIEVLWTAVPLMILFVIAIPSFKLLYFADRIEEADMTLKATGVQWYWNYQYPDHGGFEFDAYMVADADLQEGQKRLLDTDNLVVLPVDTNIRLLIAASDVLHAFALPAMGIKLDAVPGQVNETWVRINEEGTYYGQCSELCGTGHSYMPITIKAVSKAEFEDWITQAKEDFAVVDSEDDDLRVAEAAAAAGPAGDQTAGVQTAVAGD
jgi:cytochrome c oxidase subunit 2